MIIYIVRNLINGKVYIGKTEKSLTRRWNNHVWVANIGRLHSRFYHAIRRYGSSNFSIETIYRVILPEDLDRSEKRFIKEFKSLDSRYGYNMTEGGTGGRMSKEARRRQGKSLKHYFATHPEVLRKISKEVSSRMMGNHYKGMLGRHHSKKTIRKISKGNIGN